MAPGRSLEAVVDAIRGRSPGVRRRGAVALVVALGSLGAAAPEPVPLVVAVVPDAPTWRPPELPRVPRPAALVAGDGDVVVDGVFDEAAWTGAVPRALEPLADGGVPPSTSLAVAASATGVAVRVIGQEDGVATLVVDPDGAGTPWWVASITPDAVGWRRCALPDDLLGAAFPVSPKALPCTPVADLPAVRGPAGWELALPADRTEPPTTAMTWMWSERAGRGDGGTLLPSGAVPELPVVPLRTRFVAALGHAVDCGEGVVRLTLTARKPEAGGTWRWWRLRNGALLEEGTVDVTPDAPATWTVPLAPTPLSTVVVAKEAADGTLPTALVRDIGPAACTVAVSSPFARTTVELAYDLVSPVPGRELVLATSGGDVLGRATVDLPAGTGVVRIQVPPGWRDAVAVTVAPWLADVVVPR